MANPACVIQSGSKTSPLITSAFLYSMATLLTELALHFWAAAHSGALLKELARLIQTFSFNLHFINQMKTLSRTVKQVPKGI